MSPSYVVEPCHFSADHSTRKGFRPCPCLGSGKRLRREDASGSIAAALASDRVGDVVELADDLAAVRRVHEGEGQAAA